MESSLYILVEMGRTQEIRRTQGEQNRSIECSIALRGVAPLVMCAVIGFIVGAGNFQDWFQGEHRTDSTG